MNNTRILASIMRSRGVVYRHPEPEIQLHLRWVKAISALRQHSDNVIQEARRQLMQAGCSRKQLGKQWGESVPVGTIDIHRQAIRSWRRATASAAERVDDFIP